jgi:hypothetical protein
MANHGEIPLTPYVDDSILMSSNLSLLNRFMLKLATTLKWPIMERSHYLKWPIMERSHYSMRIEVLRDIKNEQIHLNKKRYAKGILWRFKMDEC